MLICHRRWLVFHALMWGLLSCLSQTPVSLVKVTPSSLPSEAVNTAGQASVWILLLHQLEPSGRTAACPDQAQHSPCLLLTAALSLPHFSDSGGQQAYLNGENYFTHPLLGWGPHQGPSLPSLGEGRNKS